MAEPSPENETEAPETETELAEGEDASAVAVAETDDAAGAAAPGPGDPGLAATETAGPQSPGELLEDEYEDEPEPAPMPVEGRFALVMLWLFATAICSGFMIVAAMLVFNLAAADVPEDETVRSAAAALVLGTLTVLHVIVAVKLRQARDWARKAAVVLQALAIAACVAGLFVSMELGRPDGFRLAGACVLGIVFYSSMIALLRTRAMLEWCGHREPLRR